MLVSRLTPSSTGRARPTSRRAAAVAEFALVLPFIALLLNGVTEVGRAIMIRQFLNDTVRKACRTGVLPHRSNSDITNEITNILTDNNIDTSGVVITILVNGQSVDASTAQKNDEISVNVSIPFSQVSWTPAFFLGNTSVESETLVMMRQG